MFSFQPVPLFLVLSIAGETIGIWGSSIAAVFLSAGATDMMTWTCCQCNFSNRDGHYCGGQLPGSGQIAYSVACGHGRCLMCVEVMERPAALYSQAQYQGYQQPFSHSDVYQPPFPPPPAEHLPQTQHPYLHPSDPIWQSTHLGRRPDVEQGDQDWLSQFRPRQPPPPNPNQQESPLQTYLTSRMNSQSRKPCVMTIGEYDKMMSGPPAYTPPVGYLADYATLTSDSNPPDPNKPRKRDKMREEMMLREEKTSFGFAERIWRKHCGIIRSQNELLDNSNNYGDGMQNEMQQGEEVKMELDEEEYAQLQQISRRKRDKGDGRDEGEVGGRSKKVKSKGKEREREQPVAEVPRISRRDKGKEREQGQDYFTGMMQGAQAWSFGGLEGQGMDIDGEGDGERDGGGRNGCYQATVEDDEEEL